MGTCFTGEESIAERLRLFKPNPTTTGEVSSSRLTSCPGVGESHLSSKCHRKSEIGSDFMGPMAMVVGTSFTGKVSSDRLTSSPGVGKSPLSSERHGNQRLAQTLWALWPYSEYQF